VTCAASSAKAGKLGSPAAKASNGRTNRRSMIGVKIFFNKFFILLVISLWLVALLVFRLNSLEWTKKLDEYR
jgi:hypothetical protein